MTIALEIWAKNRLEEIEPILKENGGDKAKQEIRVCLIPPNHRDLVSPDSAFTDYRSRPELLPISGHARALYELLAAKGYEPYLRPWRSDVAYTQMCYESEAMYRTRLPGHNTSIRGRGYLIVARA